MTKCIYLKLVCLTLSGLMLTGCSGLYDREYVNISAHHEQDYGQSEPDALSATSFTTLKSALLQLIRSGKEEGSIKMSGYTGDVSHDLPLACGEVCNDSPFGSYAVESMFYEKPSLQNSYQADIFIKYRRTKDQISGLSQLGGVSGLQESIKKMMSEYGSYLVAEVTLDSLDTDINSLIKAAYYGQPLYAQGFPEPVVYMYPDSGFRRIVEIFFEYPGPESLLAIRSKLCKDRADAVIAAMDTDLAVIDKLRYFHDTLAATVEYDENAELLKNDGETVEPVLLTAYGALAVNRAVSEGYALAFMLLCEEAGIRCMAVSGKRGGDDRFWNVVELDGAWFHIDATEGDISGNYGYFLVPDTVLNEADYRWNTAQVPACTEESPFTEENPQPATITEGDILGV